MGQGDSRDPFQWEKGWSFRYPQRQIPDRGPRHRIKEAEALISYTEQIEMQTSYSWLYFCIKDLKWIKEGVRKNQKTKRMMNTESWAIRLKICRSWMKNRLTEKKGSRNGLNLTQEPTLSVSISVPQRRKQSLYDFPSIYDHQRTQSKHQKVLRLSNLKKGRNKGGHQFKQIRRDHFGERRAKIREKPAGWSWYHQYMKKLYRNISPVAIFSDKEWGLVLPQPLSTEKRFLFPKQEKIPNRTDSDP